MTKKSQGIQVTLSDMDGTLLDTEPLYESVHQLYMNRYNIQITQSEMDSLRGAGAEHFHSLLGQKSSQFTQDFPNHISFGKQRISEYYNTLASNPHLVEEISPVMDKFKDLVHSNAAAMIVTNSSFVTVEKTMAALSLSDMYWRNAISSDYVVKQGYDIKPSGDPYLLGLDAMNQKFSENYGPMDCVVLEDSVVGVRSALDFGGHVIHIITDASQLLSEAEVDQMRASSSYLQQHKPGSLSHSFAASYTACKPEDFEAVYDGLIADSQKNSTMPRYNNLA